MARRKRKQKKTEESGSPAWMVTFSDLMTLLLTFFVLLFSMSSISEDRFREIALSLQIALSGSSSESILDGQGEDLSDLDLNQIDSGNNVEAEDFQDLDIEDVETSENAGTTENLIPEEVHELYGVVSSYMEEEGIESELTISRDQEGVYIDIKESILFSSGSAEIKESGQETLALLSGMFTLFDNEIIIEGHTDDVPMNTAQFPSNWELSAGRAIAVLRNLSEVQDLEPTRLSAGAYGEHHPIEPNDSAENREQNRRVNLVIVHDEREEVDESEELTE